MLTMASYFFSRFKFQRVIESSGGSLVARLCGFVSQKNPWWGCEEHPALTSEQSPRSIKDEGSAVARLTKH